MKRRIPRKLKKKLEKMFTPKAIKLREKSWAERIADAFFKIEDTPIGPLKVRLIYLDDLDNEKLAKIFENQQQYKRVDPQPPSVIEAMQGMQLVYDIMHMRLEQQIQNSKNLQFNGSNKIIHSSRPGEIQDNAPGGTVSILPQAGNDYNTNRNKVCNSEGTEVPDSQEEEKSSSEENRNPAKGEGEDASLR